MEVDYIIVGQGLAGSAVAVQALARNKRILVVDQPARNHTSRIAAGLFNPITGKKMVKTWMADDVFPYLDTYYRNLEQQTGASFFHPLPLYRPFLSAAEQNEWMGRSAEPAYADYIDRVYTSQAFAGVKDIFGGLMLKRCGYLNTTAYTAAVKQMIHDAAHWVEDVFDAADVTLGTDGVRYRGWEAQKIICCHGVHDNPWFSWLPVRPLKGETISIRSDFREAVVINRGVYLVPLDEAGRWRVGSTYHFQDQSPVTTPAALTELNDKMADLVDFPYDVVTHEWGMRPTTPDRRPLLGAHPAHPQVIVFNGLGTKGVSLAPYFSEVLLRWLENTGTINKAVDIERYKSLYSNSPT